MRRHLFAILGVAFVAIALVVAVVILLQGGGPESAERPRHPQDTLATPSPTESMTAVEGEAKSPGEINAGRSVEAPELETTTPSLPASFEKALAGVIGRLVEEDGTPVAGKEVSLLELNMGELYTDLASTFEEDLPEPSLDIDSATTDADGRFRLKGARNHTLHGLGIDLGGPRAAIRVIDEALHSGELTDLGDVVLAPFVTFTGKIVDELDQPVPGARVRCTDLPVQLLQFGFEQVRSDSEILILDSPVDPFVLSIPEWLRRLEAKLPIPTTYAKEDGSFRLEGVPQGVVTLFSDAPSKLTARKGPQPTGRQAERDVGTLQLSSGSSLRGRVVDESGAPLSNVEVLVGTQLPIPGVQVAIASRSLPTDSQGAFLVRGLPESGAVVVAARLAAHAPWKIEEPFTPEDSQEKTIVLAAGHSLTVILQDQRGNPVREVEIQIRPTPFEQDAPNAFAPFLKAPTLPVAGEEGSVLVQHLSEGSYEVLARAPGLPVTAGSVNVGSEEANSITLVFAEPRELVVFVVEQETSLPVEHASVSLLYGDRLEIPIERRVTNGEGKAKVGPFSRSQERPMKLLIQHPGFAQKLLPTPPDVAELQVSLERGGSLIGRVHHAGSPPAKVYMLVINPEIHSSPASVEIMHPRTAITLPDGSFKISNLSAGPYEYTLVERFLGTGTPVKWVTELSQEFIPVDGGEVQIESGKATELSIDLSPQGMGPTATIRGSVRINGEPASGLSVETYGQHRRQRKKATTDAGGYFEILDVPVGSLQLSIVRPVEELRSDGNKYVSNVNVHDEQLELEAGELKSINLDLMQVSVPFQVLDDAGSPVANAQVMVIGAEEATQGVQQWGQSNADGFAGLQVTRAGRYHASARLPEIGRSSVLALDVPPQGLADSVQLVLQKGVPFAGRVILEGELKNHQSQFSFLLVSLLAESPEGMMQSEWTEIKAPDRTFRINGLSPGNYRVQLYAGDLTSDFVTVELPASGLENLELRFKPQLSTPKDR